MNTLKEVFLFSFHHRFRIGTKILQKGCCLAVIIFKVSFSKRAKEKKLKVFHLVFNKDSYIELVLRGLQTPGILKIIKPRGMRENMAKGKYIPYLAIRYVLTKNNNLITID